MVYFDIYSEKNSQFSIE